MQFVDGVGKSSGVLIGRTIGVQTLFCPIDLVLQQYFRSMLGSNYIRKNYNKFQVKSQVGLWKQKEFSIETLGIKGIVKSYFFMVVSSLSGDTIIVLAG